MQKPCLKVSGAKSSLNFMGIQSGPSHKNRFWGSLLVAENSGKQIYLGWEQRQKNSLLLFSCGLVRSLFCCLASPFETPSLWKVFNFYPLTLSSFPWPDSACCYQKYSKTKANDLSWRHSSALWRNSSENGALF